MNEKIIISIILPCYNGEATIGATLSSISEQTYKNFELIFIDDGSSDNSLSIAQNFQKSSTIKIKIITRENKGFLSSLSEGIGHCKGEFVARIDSDDLWDINHLELIMRMFNENPSLVLAGANARYINENSEQISLSKLPLTHKEIIKYMLKDNPFIHSSVVFKLFFYKKTKGYLIGNEKSDAHIADYNLWFELSKYGECLNLSSATLSYRVLENSMSRTMSKCTNYKARYLIMKRVYKYYKKFSFYYLVQSLKVNFRIVQNCFSLSFKK